MTASKIVYAILFWMLLLPVLYYGIKRIRQSTGKRRAALIFAAALFAAAEFLLCLVMYKTTVQTQPLIIIERGVRTAYGALLKNEDPAQALFNEGLTKDKIEPEGLERMGFQSLSNASVGIPRKSSKLEEGQGYVVSIECPEPFGIAFLLDEGNARVTIRSMRVLSKSEYEELVQDLTFFDAGALKNG